jgi:hypothetical protein
MISERRSQAIPFTLPPEARAMRAAPGTVVRGEPDAARRVPRRGAGVASTERTPVGRVATPWITRRFERRDSARPAPPGSR